jgi:hypothetical protein
MGKSLRVPKEIEDLLASENWVKHFASAESPYWINPGTWGGLFTSPGEPTPSSPRYRYYSPGGGRKLVTDDPALVYEVLVRDLGKGR